MSSTHHTLGGIAIPRTLIWVDEFDWTAPMRAQEYSLTGALVVDVALRQGGRPITLSGEADHGWVRRSALQTLHQLVNTTTGPLSLMLADGRTFSVHFAAGEPISATPIARAELPPANLPYYVTLRLVTAA